MEPAFPTPRHLVGRGLSAEARDSFRAVDPRTGHEVGPAFPEATADVIATACEAAAAAAPAFAADDRRRVELLNVLADGLEERARSITAVAELETGLGEERLTGELARTSAQLRLFAALVAEGSYQRAIIDHADPEVTPPRPDLRRRMVALGPVGVFGSSNFPLAFSVAGGDSASALAAGCPVVVKAHPAHPSTSQLVGDLVVAAAASVGMQAGVFALVHGRTIDVGGWLVDHPAITAVGFTGSGAGGRALFERGALRDPPIPVFAEMGSINPVVVSPHAARERGPGIAEGVFTAMTVGSGQFCTKPGLLLVPTGEDGDRFTAALGRRVAAAEIEVMLTPGIGSACTERTRRSAGSEGVVELARGGTAGPGARVDAVLLGTDTATITSNPELLEEHFGPTSIVVRYHDLEDLASVARVLPASLTASVFMEPDEMSAMRPVLGTLVDRAGRLVFDGYPTGVAVTNAMQHGGPYPATTDARFTSVGTAAIDRWLRPITYQDAPEALLPDSLVDGNPRGLLRLVDGLWTRR